MAGQPGRQHTVEHVDTPGDRLDDADGVAQTHEISGLIEWEEFHARIEAGEHLAAILPPAQAADGVAVGVDLPTIPGTADPYYGDAVGSIREASCGAVGGYEGVYQSGASQLPACYYSYVPFANLIEETDRYQLYGELNFDLTETTEFFLEGMYSKTDVPNIGYSPSYPPTQGPFGPGSTQYFAPKSNPYVQSFLAANPQVFASAAAAGAYAALPGSGLQLTLWRPFASGGNPAFGYDGQKGERSYELFRIATGLKGEFDVAGGIGWDLAFTYSRNQAYGVTRDILINRLDQALRGLGGPNCTGNTPGANGCEWLNPFSTAYPGNPILGGANPTYDPAQANSPALSRWHKDWKDAFAAFVGK